MRIPGQVRIDGNGAGGPSTARAVSLRLPTRFAQDDRFQVDASTYGTRGLLMRFIRTRRRVGRIYPLNGRYWRLGC